MRANPVNPPGRAGGEECCTLPTAFISSPASTFADVVCPTPASKINPTNRSVSSQTDFFPPLDGVAVLPLAFPSPTAS